MKLVRQVSLYFREGNSDKVYEIDLCSTGNDGYVVNFRYGRRGTPLKEGTKTPDPVSLYKAEEIYQGLESEKRSKGYTALGESAAHSEKPIAATIPKPAIDLEQLPPGRKKAILLRLQAIVNGNPAPRFHWKTSRVIWTAGVMRIEEAIDPIYFLATKGDTMQQYAAVWALGRCNAKQAIPLFLTGLKSGNSALQRIAAAALLQLTTGNEKERQLQFHLHSMPEALQVAITNNDSSSLKDLLQERTLAQSNQHYNFLEDIYLLSREYLWIRIPLKEILLAVPLKPNYFKHVRHIFKLAEFFDDFEIVGMLAHRFEKEEEGFQSNKNPYDEDGEVFVPALSEYINLQKELSKRTSRLAYSNRTRNYLVRRILRTLKRYGEYEDLHYVRLATALLLTYNKESDYKDPYSTSNYLWRNGNYQRVETQFPQNSDALFLNQVLFGNSPRYKLMPGNIWATIDPSAEKEKRRGNNAKSSAQNSGSGEGLIKKILNFFSGKKTNPSTAATPVPEIITGNQQTVKDDAPFIELWNHLPEAYVQLLIRGRMEEIHEFAITHLKKHSDYISIKNKLDAVAIEQLLLSEFNIPAAFAYELALERYQPSNPDIDLVKAMLYGKLEKAQMKATDWVEANKDFLLSNTGFVSAVLLSPNASVRSWMAGLLAAVSYQEEQSNDIVNRTLLGILSFQNNSAPTNETIHHAGLHLIRYFSTALKSVSMEVVSHLIQSKTSSAQALGIDIILLQKDVINIDQLSGEIIETILNSPYPPLRLKGIELLKNLSTGELLRRQEFIMHAALSEHRDVRQGVRPLIKSMAAADHSFGLHAAEWLLPYLLRKESMEGLHEDVAAVLQEDLIDYIGGVNKEMALRLLYSSFKPTQNFGISILEKYIDPKDLTIRQIIALGNHETRNVRDWTWRYFENNTARIKYEREDSIRLLDADWQDTREFAKEYFRKQFEENDWSPETLVGLADSVRPDIEAYGRELITRFFRDEHGERYLLTLSQHPSEKMQLFATNYLERFASDDIEKLQSLEFYFRSVLTRVNKARIAKNRVFRFLGEEGKKSEAAAHFVAGLISQISATVSIEDKAKCIQVLLSLQSMYAIDTPMTKKPVEERLKS